MNLPPGQLPVRTGRAELPALWGSEAHSGAGASFDLGRALKIGGGVLLVLLLLLAIVVPIGGAVLGQGKVGVESRVKRIAHPFGGVIAEILVGNGEHVDAATANAYISQARLKSHWRWTPVSQYENI